MVGSAVSMVVLPLDRLRGHRLGGPDRPGLRAPGRALPAVRGDRRSARRPRQPPPADHRRQRGRGAPHRHDPDRRGLRRPDDDPGLRRRAPVGDGVRVLRRRGLRRRAGPGRPGAARGRQRLPRLDVVGRGDRSARPSEACSPRSWGRPTRSGSTPSASSSPPLVQTTIRSSFRDGSAIAPPTLSVADQVRRALSLRAAAADRAHAAAGRVRQLLRHRCHPRPAGALRRRAARPRRRRRSDRRALQRRWRREPARRGPAVSALPHRAREVAHPWHARLLQPPRSWDWSPRPRSCRRSC